MLFSPPKIPQVATPAPTPPQNPELEAQLAQLGRRQGMLASIMGSPNKGIKQRGATGKAKLTGE
jgi:hypothetical protein